MLLNEPGRTQYDLNFQVAGIPVRVHPFFWLVVTVLGAQVDTPPPIVLMWVCVVFVSILIHELGHALTARSYGWEPQITLHGFGGLASYRPTRYDPKAQLLISAAGPAAGFAFAGLILGAIVLTGNSIRFMGFEFGDGPSLANENLRVLTDQLLSVNIFWGLINCLPILPLDGGRMTTELLNLAGIEAGPVIACQLSIVASIAMAVFTLLFTASLLLPFFFGYFAWSNYTTLQAMRGGGFGGGPRW